MFSLHTAQPAVGSTRLPIQWKPWAPSPEVKHPERATDHTHISPDIKNEWSCTSPPPLCLHGLYRDSFTLDEVFFSEVTFPVFTAVFLMMVVFWVFMRRDD